MRILNFNGREILTNVGDCVYPIGDGKPTANMDVAFKSPSKFESDRAFVARLVKDGYTTILLRTGAREDDTYALVK